MKYGNWYLDLEQIRYLDKGEQDKIHFYYREIFNKENDVDMISSFFHTLQKNRCIKIDIDDSRDEKLEELIDG